MRLGRRGAEGVRADTEGAAGVIKERPARTSAKAATCERRAAGGGAATLAAAVRAAGVQAQSLPRLLKKSARQLAH